jgi:hypothetical protein
MIVFLHTQKGQRLRVTGLRQNVYSVRRDPDTGRRMVQAIRAEYAAPSASRTNAEAGAVSKTRGGLDDFLFEIRQRAR